MSWLNEASTMGRRRISDGAPVVVGLGCCGATVGKAGLRNNIRFHNVFHFFDMLAREDIKRWSLQRTKQNIRRLSNYLLLTDEASDGGGRISRRCLRMTFISSSCRRKMRICWSR